MNRLSLAFCFFAVACTGPTSGNPKGGNATGVAVINSDYKSTAVSLLNAASAQLQQDDCIDSGALTPTLSLALSGDVVLASQPQPGGDLLLIDRTNAALVWVSPTTCKVTRELAVGTGFDANPHDVVADSPQKAYVTRYKTNLKPTGRPEARDQGEDLLIINPSQPAVIGRVDLAPYATSVGGVQLQAHPDRAIKANGSIFVLLGNANADFSIIGPPRVVIVDSSQDKVVGMIDPPGLTNCGGLDYLEVSRTLIVICGGDFNLDPAAQLAGSGLALYDVSGSAPKLAKTIPASILGGRPIGFTFSVLSGELAVASTSGDFSGTPPDALWKINLVTGSATKLADADGGFVLGGAVADNARNHVLVTNAAMATPHMSIFGTSETGSFSELYKLDTNPKSGLPPRLVGWY